MNMKRIEPIPVEERTCKALSYQADLRRYGTARYQNCTVRFWDDGVTVAIRHVKDVKGGEVVRHYPALERSIIQLKEDAGLYDE